MPRKWWSRAVLAGTLALGLAVAVSGVAQAQSSEEEEQDQAGAPITLPMTVTENRLPGGSGTVTMTPLGGNQVRVEIRVTGAPPNGQHAAHIHTAPGAVCDNGAPVTYPLTNVMVNAQGVGTSTSTVTLRADAPVTPGNAYVNVHVAASPPGPGVICANVTSSFVAGGAAQAAPGAQRPAGAAQPAQAQRPAGAVAQPQAQRPAGAAAQPGAQRPASAAAPATRPAAQTAGALPRSGVGLTADSATTGALLAGLGALLLVLGGSGALAFARRR
jgi:hypothetical protein